MKKVTVEQLAQDLNALLDSARQGRILVTRNGEPCALIVGLDNKDEEDLLLEESPEFWRMIQERRKEPTIPLEAIKAELFADDTEPATPGSS
jgi:prevent-host-death family protein